MLRREASHLNKSSIDGDYSLPSSPPTRPDRLRSGVGSMAGISLERGSRQASMSLSTADLSRGTSYMEDIASGGSSRLEEPTQGRLVHALELYDACAGNKVKSNMYGVTASELYGKGGLKGSKEMVGRLRELCIRVGDSTSLNGLFFDGLVRALKESKDKDWDRKCVRYIHFFMRAMLGPEGDTEGKVTGEHWRGRGITMPRLMEAMEVLEADTRHSFVPRRFVSYQTMSIVCGAAVRWAGGLNEGGDPTAGAAATPDGVLASRAQEMMRSTLTKLREDNKRAGTITEKSGIGWKRSGKKVAEGEHKEQLLLSRTLFSALRRSSFLHTDLGLLQGILEACTAENDVTARHAFAVLAEFAKVKPNEVSSAIYPLLQPTTVASMGHLDMPDQPNLGDPLACVYYLRTLKTLVFSVELDKNSRLDFYRTIANSVSDHRHRVALEAVQCLMDHEQAWMLLVDAQQQSRDADMFRRVVACLHSCLAAAGVGKGGGGGVDPNWPLAHAACRVCRVVGQTLQKALSFEAMSHAAAEAGGLDAQLSLRVEDDGEESGQRSPSPRSYNNSNLLDFLSSPEPVAKAAPTVVKTGAQEQLILDLCHAIREEGLIDCTHHHVRSLALEAMFLLLPAPSAADVSLTNMWRQLQRQMESCPSFLPVPSLVRLLGSLMVRVECSASSRASVVPIALNITASFFRQMPTASVGLAVLRSWVQCIGYGGPCREVVLTSVHAMLDAPFPAAAQNTNAAEDDLGGSSSSSGGGLLPPSNKIRRPSHIKIPRGTGNNAPGSRSSGRWSASSQDISSFASTLLHHGSTTTDDTPPPPPPLGEVAWPAACSATQEMRRLAMWFMGEYCCELVGAPTPESHEHFQVPTSANLAPSVDIFLAAANQSIGTRHGSISAGSGWGANGVAGAPPHPITAGLNASVVSILLRLKQASVFEDYMTRIAAAGALCKVALFLPDPVRFDVYLFLKGILSYDFNPAAPAPSYTTYTYTSNFTPGAGAFRGDSNSGTAENSYLSSQAYVIEGLDTAPCFGLAEVVQPVLAYLGAQYEAFSGGPQTPSAGLLNLFKNVLEPQKPPPPLVFMKSPTNNSAKVGGMSGISAE